MPSTEELLELASSTGLRLLDGEQLELGHCSAHRVNLNAPCEAYVLDSPEGRELAARPELIGGELIEASRRLALSAALLLNEVLERDAPKVFVHVLRGSLGYRLHEALKLKGAELFEAWLRPKYVRGGLGDHRHANVKLEYEDLSALELLADAECNVVVADTVATGCTLAACLQRLREALSELNVKLRALTLYGFLSLPGLLSVLKGQWAERTIAVTVEDFAALALNMYDMPLYGVDGARYAATGKVESIGGATVFEALEGLAPRYAPGMDQPGDWSERQPLLVAGHRLEEGDVTGHLRRSLEALERLRALARRAEWYRPWMEEVYAERERGLGEALARVARSRVAALL